MTNEERKLDIEKRLDEKQNDYFGLLTGIKKNGQPVDKDEDFYSMKNQKFVYQWERMKELQKEIIYLTNHNREISLEIARESLDRAFTPRIKKMLEKTSDG